MFFRFITVDLRTSLPPASAFHIYSPGRGSLLWWSEPSCVFFSVSLGNEISSPSLLWYLTEGFILYTDISPQLQYIILKYSMKICWVVVHCFYLYQNSQPLLNLWEACETEHSVTNDPVGEVISYINISLKLLWYDRYLLTSVSIKHKLFLRSRHWN